MAIGIITNSRYSNQPSMIGYGELMSDLFRRHSIRYNEYRVFGWNSNSKVQRNIARYVITPMVFAGKDARLIHAVDPGSSIYFPLMRKEATSITVHDVIPFLAERGKLDGFRPTSTGRFALNLIKKQYQKADTLIAVSESTKDDLVNLLGVEERKVTVIPNAVFNALHRVDETDCEKFRKKYAIPAAKKIVLNIGKNFYKNRSAVVEVFNSLAKSTRDESHLVFASPPSQELMAQIAKYNLEEQVTFIAWVDENDLSSLYSLADVLLFPSLYEGFGYPVLEAQMCGTPVVSSSRGSLKEVCGCSAPMFETEDYAGMALETNKILEDTEYANELRKLGRENVDRFSVANWSSRYLEHFIKYT